MKKPKHELKKQVKSVLGSMNWESPAIEQTFQDLLDSVPEDERLEASGVGQFND